MSLNRKYGSLLTPDIKLHRQYFNEMVKLHGINVIYRSLKPGMKWTTYGEVDANYNKPELLGCLFDEHPTQQTLKKIGWVSELQESSSIIHVKSVFVKSCNESSNVFSYSGTNSHVMLAG